MTRLITYCTLLSILISCTKEGTGGEGRLYGNVMHHSTPIPSAEVYIKYGAEEFPGTDISVYDDTQTSDSLGHFSFDGLTKGDYYLFAKGYDPAIIDSVEGGIRARIVKKTSEVEVTLPITESNH